MARIKRLVKLKFESEQDLLVVERVAKSLKIDVNELTRQAVFSYVNALMEMANKKAVKAATNESEVADGGAKPEDAAGTEHSTEAAPNSAALADPSSSDSPVT